MPGEQADAPALLQLSAMCFGDSWSPGDFRKAMADGALTSVTVAKRAATDAGEPDPRVVGYIVFRVVVDEMEILDLAVAPDARRKGLGRRLVNTALEGSARRDVRAVYLEVRESNAAARSLYGGMGFIEHSRRPGYYDNPREAAIVLKRS